MTPVNQPRWLALSKGQEAMNLNPIDQLRLRRGAEHLHCLGPRAFAEMLVEFGEKTGTAARIITTLEDYGRLTPEMLRAAGGDRFPRPLRVVAK